MWLGGLFDTVKGSGYDANNNWYVVRTFNNANTNWVRLYTASALSAGYYGGSGNGVNGEVLDLTLSSVGDLYVAGNFTQAGGFPYSHGIGMYGYQYGWNTTYVFSAFDYANKFTWVSSNKLKVEGPNLWEVDFNGSVLQVSGNVAYWNLYNGTFGSSDYWSAQ